jgi:site-specific recombinase XerD
MNSSKATLQSVEYKLLLQSFKEWLQLLNYSPFSLPGLSGSVRDFLLYQEQVGKTSLTELAASDAPDFMKHLQTITGTRTGRPFSANHLNKQVQALKLFSRYLRETGRSTIGFTLQRLVDKTNKPAWLTKEEIERLYEVMSDDVLGIRDKAMLAVYYGCGLRLNEGASLELKDIDTASKVLHIRKGKQYRERLVPMAEKSYAAIQYYINYGRPQLLQEVKTTALFIDANKGRPMHKQSLYVRIKQLTKRAKINKKVGTHTLRHSIATHLLQSGMKLERIQAFLGHSHLDSTQIYTHLKNETI